MLQFENDLHIVTNVNIPYGQYWRPLWKTLETSSPYDNLKRISRFDPHEAIACEWGMALVYAQMSQYIAPKRGEALRTLAAEIQELLWLSNYVIRMLQACDEKIYCNNFYLLKEIVLDMQEQWFGSRILPQFILLNGVERDLTIGIQTKLEAQMRVYEQEFMLCYNHVVNDALLLERMEGVMHLSNETIKTFSWGGVAAIAAGINIDVRSNSKYGAYQTIPAFEIKHLKNSDAATRFIVAIEKIKYHISVVKTLMSNLPVGQYQLDHSEVYESPNGFFSSAIQAPSGPLYVSYMSKKIYISSTSTRVKAFVPHLLLGTEVEDLELAYASLGLSIEQGALA
jgi:NADH:ubiquinone oxidoreductase subunit D